MTQFFIHDGKEQTGPFDFENAHSMGIRPDTMIWHDGIDGWKPAKDLPEFEPVLKKPTPPPFVQPPAPFSQPPQPPKKSKSWLGFLLILVGVAVAYVAFHRNQYVHSQDFGGSSYSPPPVPPRTYEEKVVGIGEQEGSQPTRFLDARGNYRPTLFGNDFKIDGKITSSATVANFKDIVVQVTYYSATNTVLGSERITVYQYVPAGGRVSFKYRANPPGGTKQLGWDVVDAVPVR